MTSQQRIVVDYEVLDQYKGSLLKIRTEFEKTKESTEELLGHLGHFRLKDAMTEFSANWDRKRGKLIEMIKTTEDGTGQVMTAFKALDTKAAKFDICTPVMKNPTTTSPR
jgi:hypothetical protein